MSQPGIIAAISAGLASLITGAFGLIFFILNRNKLIAEVEKLRAETDQIEEETRDLTSSRLLKEVERLLAWNKQQGEMIEAQRLELDKLRLDIMRYAAREIEHAAENTALRNHISELTRSEPNFQGSILRSAFPIEIPHKDNEFDARSGTIDSNE